MQGAVMTRRGRPSSHRTGVDCSAGAVRRAPGGCPELVMGPPPPDVAAGLCVAVWLRVPLCDTCSLGSQNVPRLVNRTVRSQLPHSRALRLCPLLSVVREDDDMDQELALLHQLNPAMAETNVPGLDVARVTSSKLKGQFEVLPHTLPLAAAPESHGSSCTQPCEDPWAVRTVLSTYKRRMANTCNGPRCEGPG